MAASRTAAEVAARSRGGVLGASVSGMPLLGRWGGREAITTGTVVNTGAMRPARRGAGVMCRVSAAKDHQRRGLHRAEVEAGAGEKALERAGRVSAAGSHMRGVRIRAAILSVLALPGALRHCGVARVVPVHVPMALFSPAGWPDFRRPWADAGRLRGYILFDPSTDCCGVGRCLVTR